MAPLLRFVIPPEIREPILVFEEGHRKIWDRSIFRNSPNWKKISVLRIEADFGEPIGVRVRDVTVYEITPEQSTGNSRHPGPPAITKRSGRCGNGNRPGGRGRGMTGGKIVFGIENFPTGAAIDIWKAPVVTIRKLQSTDTKKNLPVLRSFAQEKRSSIGKVPKSAPVLTED